MVTNEIAVACSTGAWSASWRGDGLSGKVGAFMMRNQPINRPWRRISACATVLALALWSVSAATALGAEALSIDVEGAWVRWLPADLPAAGYVSLTNRGSSAIELVGASSDAYAEVGMHQTRDDHGMSEMRPVASLELKPGVAVRFVAGGYHLMLMRPKRPVHPGDRLNIVFRFSDGRTMPVSFEVRSGG